MEENKEITVLDEKVTVMKDVDPKDLHYYMLETYGVNQHQIQHDPYIHLNICDPSKIDHRANAIVTEKYLKEKGIQVHCNYADYPPQYGGHFSLVTLHDKSKVEEILKGYGVRYSLHEINYEEVSKLTEEFVRSFEILRDSIKDYFLKLGESLPKHMKETTA